MRYGWVAFLLISIGLISITYGSTGELFQSSLKESHRLSSKECDACHVDAEKDPGLLKAVFNSICVECHIDIQQPQSHPLDVSSQVVSIPDDMPLVDGRLGCITCHYFHPFSDKYNNRSGNLLRRPAKGTAFCIACHRSEEKGHVVFESIHRDSNCLTARNSALDVYTLQCVECHDKYLGESLASVSEGRRNPFDPGWKHPVGVSVERIAAKKPRKFNQVNMLPKEIRLFNGRIGCGTCHNAFSKEKSMLVMSNWRSRLCLKCHIK